MTVRVAISGFGRIGRNVFRALYARDDLEVVAINDIADPKSMEYLLRFDSLHGPFSEPVRILENNLYAKGRRIPVLHFTEPGEVPWYDYGADVVVEATGRYRTRDALQKHLDMGAARVILSTAPADDIDAIHIRGVTPASVRREDRIISCGSSTANCTLVLLQVLDRAFGVKTGFFTSVHAYTGEQSLIDVPSSIDLRLSRAAVENIVPLHSWTRTAVEMMFPRLKGRFGGYKLNVPVPDVSCVDLVTMLSKDVTKLEIQEVFRSAANSDLKGVLDFTEKPIVSSDVAGVSASCVFDSLATMIVQGNMVKTLGWYEQGGGLSHRIVDLIGQLEPSMSSDKGGGR